MCYSCTLITKEICDCDWSYEIQIHLILIVWTLTGIEGIVCGTTNWCSVVHINVLSIATGIYLKSSRMFTTCKNCNDNCLLKILCGWCVWFISEKFHSAEFAWLYMPWICTRFGMASLPLERLPQNQRNNSLWSSDLIWQQKPGSRLSQGCHRQCHGAANNDDMSLVMFCGNHMRPISQRIF